MKVSALLALVVSMSMVVVCVSAQVPGTCPAPVPSGGFLKKAGCNWIRQADNGTIGECCDKKDECYYDCSKSKSECDEGFRECMLDLCINEFVPANPGWGGTEKCLDYWTRLDAAGAKRWRLDRARDFSCNAYQKAQETARCAS